MSHWRLFFSDPLRKKAMFCNLALALLLLIRGAQQFSPAQLGMYALISAAQWVFLVWLIFRLRGEEKQDRTQVNRVTSIGVWGYCWRSVLIYGLSASGVVLSALTLGLAPPSQPSLMWMITFNLMIACAMPLVCWLLFSRDRKGQLLWLLAAVR